MSIRVNPWFNCRFQIKPEFRSWGAHASGVLWLASRQPVVPLTFSLLSRRTKSNDAPKSVNPERAFGGTPKATRGTRVLSISTSEFGLNYGKFPRLPGVERREPPGRRRSHFIVPVSPAARLLARRSREFPAPRLPQPPLPLNSRALGREISPIYFITAKTAPRLIIHGDADKLVPFQQADIFAATARAAGVAAQLLNRPGKVHGWPEMGADQLLFADWFDQHLRGLKAKP